MASQNPHGASRKSREGEHNGEAHMRTNEILRETIEEFKERSDDLKTLVTEYVQEKPLKALGIALVSGIALALFLKR